MRNQEQPQEPQRPPYEQTQWAQPYRQPEQTQYGVPPVLNSASQFQQTQWAGMEYDMPPPPPPMEYGGYQYHPDEKILEHRSGISIFRIIRGIFYFIAVFTAAFGLFGSFNSFGHSSLLVGLGLFFMFGLIVAGIVLFLRMRRRITKLRLAQFIWWILGATVGMFMAAILESAFIPNFSNVPVGSFIFGCIFLLYGLVLAAIALW